jgi:acetyl esterase/lipase
MSSAEPGRVTVQNDVVIGTGGGRELKADIYTPPGAPKEAPAVLLIHGGGWIGGDRSQLRGYGFLLGRKGYVCVSCEYRLAPGANWPAQVHDVKAALRWMRANAAELGIDPGRIAVSGNSAGGHLSLMVAGTQNVPEFEGEGGNPGVSTSVAAAISFYPPVVLQANGRLGSEPEGQERNLESAISSLMGPGVPEAAYAGASPSTHAAADFPPTMLVHGTDDDLVPDGESLGMYAALRKAGAPVEMHMFAGQPHGFDADPILGRACADLMLNFLARYVPAK